jgi:hypothetical protein
LIGWTTYRTEFLPRQIAAAAQKCFDEHKANPALGNPFDCFDSTVGVPTFDDLIPIWPAIAKYVGLGIGGPAALFGLGSIWIWVVSGFRRSPI